MAMGRKAKIVFVIIMVFMVMMVFAAMVVPRHLKKMVFEKPVSYNPPILTKVQQEAAEARGWEKSQEFYNNVQRDESFTMTFEQQMVNDLLVHDDVKGFIGKTAEKGIELGVLQVEFADGVISVITPTKFEGREVFLTVRLKPTMVNSGLYLRVELLKPKAGTLALPDFAIEKQLGQLTYKLEDAYMKAHSNSDGKESARSEEEVEDMVQDMIIPTIIELIREKEVEMVPKFKGDSDRWARLADVEVADGKLVLEIQPLGE